MSLTESGDRNPYLIVGRLCVLRRENKHSDKEIAKKLGFDSVEDMYARLEGWELPGWLIRQKASPAKTKGQKKPPRRLRRLGPAKELPPLSDAAELFKERLEALRESVELLEHINEGLYGKYFARTHVETASVLYDGHWTDDAVVSLPNGVAQSPSDIAERLISVYALAGGRMDLLVEALHPDPPPVGAEAWEEIGVCVDGSKADGDKRDGLTVLARLLATWVRGGEVRSGRPSGLSEVDHGFACAITHYRKHGLTDEEIARKESHRKKEDGTSYSVKDITEFGDMGLSWS